MPMKTAAAILLKRTARSRSTDGEYRATKFEYQYFTTYVSVKVTLQSILTGLLHFTDYTHVFTAYVGCMWRPGRHRLSYSQAWPEDRRHVTTASKTWLKTHLFQRSFL